jgi:hypothetical protein
MSSWKADSLSSVQENPWFSIETEYSVPYTEKSATVSHNEPIESDPYSNTSFV